MEQVSTVLYSLYKGRPEHAEWMVACLRGAWSGILGERIAQACRPSGWKEYRLTVEVLDPAWLDPLTSMRAEILERLRESTKNEVRSIEFRTPPTQES